MSVNHNTAALQEMIRRYIEQAGGWIPFDRFMSAALYEPALGYYESGQVFGAEGDFVTGAELGPWLSLGYADLIEWGWQELGKPAEWTLLEQGGGGGELFVDVVELLSKKGIPMAEMVAVEASSHMRERQARCYASRGLSVAQYARLEELGELENCLMFCNELPDAFPVRCFTRREGDFIERGVAHSQGRFIWENGPMLDSQTIQIDDAIHAAWPEGYISEWNPNLAPWQSSVSAVMKRGFVFCVDYGYSQQEYYRPQRMEGTLMAHRGHRVVDNVLADPGSCDITAHIDFSSLNTAGEDCGLASLCFMTQGAWLAQSPSVQQCIESLAVSGSVESVQQLAHAKRMLLPFGMGNSFKLLIQAAHIEHTAPDYLTQFNQLGDLTKTIGGS